MIDELGRAEIDELLRAQVVGRVGCHAYGLTYVVPVIYAYDGESLFVQSLEGQKIRMMRANPRVCFEVDEYDGRGSWRSAIVQGTYEELEGEEAARGLALLVERFAARPAATGEGEPRRRGDGRVVPFRVRVDEVTGRAVRREPA